MRRLLVLLVSATGLVRQVIVKMPVCLLFLFVLFCSFKSFCVRGLEISRFCVSCFHEDLWDEIKEDAEADWKAFKQSFNNGIQNVEKEVREDWDVVKEKAKEDWKVVKEKAKEDWNKLDLDWNKLALSDSKVVPGENAESEEAESEGKKK